MNRIGTSKWPCPSCDKSFGRKGDLTRHKVLHTGVKPHKCKECGKDFVQFSGLKTHLNKHSGDKPFFCGFPGCRASFGDPSSCARHRKETHRRVGAYRCPHGRCKSSIKRRSAFAAHLRKHDIDPAEVDIDSMAPPLLPAPAMIPRRRSTRSTPVVAHFEETQTKSSFSVEKTREMWNALSTMGPTYSNPSPAPPLFANNYNTLFHPQQYSYPQQSFNGRTILPGSMYSVNSTPGPITPPHLTYSASPSPTPSGSQINTPKGTHIGTRKTVNVPVHTSRLSPLSREDVQLSYFANHTSTGYHDRKIAFDFLAYERAPG